MMINNNNEKLRHIEIGKLYKVAGELAGYGELPIWLWDERAAHGGGFKPSVQIQGKLVLAICKDATAGLGLLKVLYKTKIGFVDIAQLEEI